MGVASAGRAAAVFIIPGLLTSTIDGFNKSTSAWNRAKLFFSHIPPAAPAPPSPPCPAAFAAWCFYPIQGKTHTQRNPDYAFLLHLPHISEQNFLYGSIVRTCDWHCAQAHPWLLYANVNISNTCFVLGVFTNWTHSSIRRRVKYASLDTKASIITPSCSAPSSRGLVLYLQDRYIQLIPIVMNILLIAHTFLPCNCVAKMGQQVNPEQWTQRAQWFYKFNQGVSECNINATHEKDHPIVDGPKQRFAGLAVLHHHCACVCFQKLL